MGVKTQQLQMAQNKKSFILYTDLIETVEKLPDEIAGKLLKLILQYVNDKNPVTDDLLLQIAFEPVRQQLKRDLKEWELKRKKRSDAGKKGMEHRWNSNNNDNKVITKDNNVINGITKITDNVTVNDNVNDNVNVNKNNKFIIPTLEQIKKY